MIQEKETKLDIEEIKKIVADDMELVKSSIIEHLHSDIELIGEIGTYIIESGGKRLRPLLLLLVAKSCNYTGNQHIVLAAIIEFIHTATLLHDDVVDLSDLRRGLATANNIWGDQAAVLVGDFLYSRSFQMMIKVGKMEVMEVLADATNIISEGEVLQLINCRNVTTTESECLEIIRYKTAKLFEATATLGAIIAGSDNATEKAFANYGMHLGTAFQLIDDVLDYSSNDKEMGKKVGDDLAEGKPTMPIVLAMNSDKESAKIVQNALKNGGRENITEVIEVINKSGALERTIQIAKAEAEKAKKNIQNLPSNKSLEALIAVADFAVARSY